MQQGISRQTIRAALQDAAQTERGYLTKLLIVSAIGKLRLVPGCLRYLRFGTQQCCVMYAGAAAVKFGSLLISTPFQPSSIIALSIITVPCLMFSALLLTWRDEKT